MAAMIAHAPDGEPAPLGGNPRQPPSNDIWSDATTMNLIRNGALSLPVDVSEEERPWNLELQGMRDRI